MAIRNWMLALLLGLTLALAGCGGPDEDTTDDGTGTMSGTDTPTPTEEPPSEIPAVGSCDTTASAAVALNARGICTFEDMGINGTGYKSGLVEMTWDSLQPGVLEVALNLESNSCSTGVGGNDCTIKETSGLEAPLTIKISTADLEKYGGDAMKVVAEVSGAAAEQSFTIYVSLFELDQVPQGYSAI